MASQVQKSIKFEDYKEQIVSAIKSRSSSLGIHEPVTIVDGFTNLMINKEMTGSLVIGGPTIPAIILVGKTTGRIYTFAAKALGINFEV